MSALHVENGAQFLIAPSVLFPAFTVVFPVTKINALEWWQILDLILSISN